MGTSDGVRKGWTEERRKQQQERMRKKWADADTRSEHAKTIRKTWDENPERKITQGNKISKALRTDEWERFNSHIASPNDEGCELWTSTLVFGYGRFSPAPPKQGVVASQVSAIRWLWEKTKGPIPEGMTIEHDCHTRNNTCLGGVTCIHRACMNLEHVYLISGGENSSLGHQRQKRIGIEKSRTKSGKYSRKEGDFR
jgi:hypothetical protein